MGTRRALRALQGGSFTIEEDPEVITGEAAEELRRFLRARNDRIIREAARMGQLLTDRQTPTNEIVHRIGLPTGFWKGWQRGISRSERDHNVLKTSPDIEPEKLLGQGSLVHNICKEV